MQAFTMVLQHTCCAYTIPYTTIQDISIAVVVWMILLNNSFIIFPNLEGGYLPRCGKNVNDRVVSVEAHLI